IGISETEDYHDKQAIGMDDDGTIASGETYDFPITIVYNENESEQKASLEGYIQNVESNLQNTNVIVTWVDKESEEGSQIIETVDARFLPIFVTDSTIESHPQYAEFAPALEEINGVLTIRSEGLEYLKVPEIGDAQIIGADPENADVVIIEYISYTCGFCARMHTVLEEAVEKYEGQVSWAVKNFDRGGPDSTLSQAAECAADQGRFKEMSSALYATQNDIMTSLQDANPDEALNDTIEQIATNAGVDSDELLQCIEDGTYEERVMEQSVEGREFGIMGTPSMFINDQFVPGAVPAEQLDAIIQEELAE
ncbi:thioredoxin domain-containing protein, partial [Candidatus Peregrinibacteria bacterium]|nr:thioredoxin domain-containing protein [Candidatus Peregrinibacteria bacterium]